MGRATRTELLWAYAITREEFLKHVNDKFELHPEEWKKIRDTLFDAMSKGESPIYEPKMNAFLEQTVYKYCLLYTSTAANLYIVNRLCKGFLRRIHNPCDRLR